MKDLYIFAALALAAGSAVAAEITMEITAPARQPAAHYAPGPGETAAIEPRAGAAPGFAPGSAAAADLQRRGGAQGDLAVRGGSFQQTLLLVDGVPANDPQTAHHNLDLPFTSFDAGSAEVLPGPHSPLYGPDAYAGAVSLRTVRPAGNACGAALTLGEFSTRAGLASCTRSTGRYSQRVSVEKARSGGFRPGTDYETATVFTRAAADLPSGRLDASLGWLDKDFGASRFYSTVLSGERERTSTAFAAVSHSSDLAGFSLEPKVYFRRHYDRFSYVYNSAARANAHVSLVSGAELRAARDLGALGSASAGADYAESRLDSSSMGGHAARRAGLFAGWEFPAAPRLRLSAALRADSHSSWGWQYSPGLRADYSLSPEAGLWTAAGGSYRAPSFTELYYNDPGNRGDPALKPERAATYEAGAGWRRDRLSLKASAFRRDEKEILDWTRTGSAGQWRAANTGRAKVTGGELSAGAAAGDLGCALGYAYAYKAVPTRNYVSKYALRYARHKAGLRLDWAPPGALGLGLDLAAVKRAGEAGYALAGAAARKQFGELSAEAALENLLDADYEEIPGAGAPGRSFRFSLRYAFN